MKKRIISLVAGAAVAVLALSGCSDSTDAGDNKDLTIAVFNGWEEGQAVSYLWEQILTDKGYTVTLTNANVAPVYAGLSTGDYDVVLDTWLPATHATYMERYGDELEDLGAWFDEAQLTIAVNEDSPIQSLDELAGAADSFGNRIVGIESGAGLTRVTTEDVIPGYQLEDMDFQVSSTPAMLSELTAATENDENIVVTLWQPHWAYDAFPIRNLEDPKGLLGTAEGIHSIARIGLAEDKAEVYGWLRDFQMNAEQLYSLENALFNSDADASDYPEITKKWMADNTEYVDSLTT
ncbi:glycine betaine ABC transporter substrate-binding protein [Klugiella xanthotipulae]|uniref:Glycine betaine/proline transport system substrate-binding protein n=1 Tax=Klugiella xanthotipulae TaxID=244735 RepID=A0A543HYP0_9MICO|nr:glycine betaine ABC transporter substrate-binding protein [Klugiella xanthotipulae]TQM63438.1 glycine betaine/proline transport system substrate-binding protein [Klugiella xanthotipulae]